MRIDKHVQGQLASGQFLCEQQTAFAGTAGRAATDMDAAR
jgi:hypothetical protein